MLFKSFKNTHHINLHLSLCVLLLMCRVLLSRNCQCVLGLTQEQFLLDSLFDLFNLIIF
uniref:PRO0786 n=1 Tax=Homo sapiens TaxID=9606 RepID=Q9P1I4_HUMAN